MPPVPETDSPVPMPTSEEVTEKFRKILESNGITDKIAEVIVKDAGLKGEGFASQTNLATIHFQDPSKKPLNLFIKTETSNPTHTDFIQEGKLFEKESTFYMKYVSAARELLQPLGEEDLLRIYPKCYYGDSNMIVFENLVERGFEILDKLEQQDLDAAKLALNTLATHHAISYALIKDMGGYEVLLKNFPSFETDFFASSTIKGMMEPVVVGGIHSSIEILEKSSAVGKTQALEILRSRRENAWECLSNALILDPQEARLHVLNHADFWNNNMMFCKDKKTNQLVDHVAIDLQGVRYDSPTTDLGYYLFSSVKPEVRREHLKDLLNMYLDVLNSTSARLGFPINLSYDELFTSFRKKFEFGFWFIGIMSSNKAGFMAMKKLDVTKLDMKDFGEAFSALIQEWISLNPETTEESARELVKLMQEYKELTML